MRAQASFEFMIMVIFVLFFILAFYVSVFGKELLAGEEEKRKEIENICNSIADKINSAVYYGNGFSQNISLPEKLYGANYSVKVLNKTLICDAGKYNSIEKFVAETVTDSKGKAPPFTLEHKKIKIENPVGIVVIS